jgi:hypothetical protein
MVRHEKQGKERKKKEVNQCQARKNYATLAVQGDGSRLDKLKNTKKI